MTLRIKTDAGNVEMSVDRFWTLSEIRRSARTTFGVFAHLKGRKILARSFVVTAQLA